MKIKNTSKKIINIGKEIILPNDEIAIDDATAASPSIKALESKGYLKLTKEAPAKKEKKIENVDKTGEPKKA